jgi:hypothetical protein
VSTYSNEYRAVEYWPNEDERVIFGVKRTPETDAMTDKELILRYRKVVAQAMTPPTE